MKVLKTQKLKSFVNGEFLTSSIDAVYSSINPSTGEEFAQIQNANAQDMGFAILSARRAFDEGQWSNLTYAERGIFLKKIAKVIRSNAKELAQLESLDVGKTLKHTTLIDVPTCADTFDYFSDIKNILDDCVNEVEAPVDSLTTREPVGVVGCISPWNYPLIMFGWKMAQALITGNTVVYKPSPLASVSVLRLAELIKDIGLPKGVLNIVATDDLEVSKQLVNSFEVDMVSFTGGTETGREIMKIAADSIKKITLELGGKSPNIVFADCNLEAALGGTMTAIFMNQGQMCTAGSRLLIEENIYDEFIAKLVKKTKSLKIGNATEFTTEFGPVISKAHRDNILDFIQNAVSQGAEIACGGVIPGSANTDGFFIEPTILTNVTNDMDNAQEEIFGPVLSVMKFKDVDEAIKIANDSKYGLAASVWSKDEQKTSKIAKKLKSGTVWINTYGGFYNGVSFGGYKQSGFGRELGLEGLLEYTQSKHICIDQTPGGMPLPAGWF